MSTLNEATNIRKFGKDLGYLPYMIERYISILGEEETKKLLQFNETKLPQIIRFNSLRKPHAETEMLLKKKQVVMERVKNFPEARRVIRSPVPIGATEEYLNGFYMLQGENSLYPSSILNPKNGELVGDLAAAPGGKTTHLAQLMNNRGTIVAIEISAFRSRSLKSNLARMGVQNSIVINMDSQNIQSLNLEFDKILLDAPCSGSGTIISDPTRKISKTIDDLLKYHELQVSLLTNAINVLRTQGEIVYSTCSLEPEENELVITKVLESKDMKIEEINIIGENGLTKFETYNFDSEMVKAKRLYPHKTCGEGFFIVKMVKE